MLNHITRALAQFTIPGTWGVVLKAIALTVLVFAGLFMGAQWSFGLIPEVTWSLWGMGFGWVNNVVAFIGGLGVIVALIFLLLPVSALVLGFFVEELANKVEERWYNGTGRLREPSIAEMISVLTRFFLSVIFLNILFLPFYFLPGFNVVIYLVLNGFLVGREFFEMVALRHKTPKEVKKLRRKNGFTIFLGGVVTTLALSIPVVNFVAPVFGAALMVHIYKELAANERH